MNESQFVPVDELVNFQQKHSSFSLELGLSDGTRLHNFLFVDQLTLDIGPSFFLSHEVVFQHIDSILQFLYSFVFNCNCIGFIVVLLMQLIVIFLKLTNVVFGLTDIFVQLLGLSAEVLVALKT